MHNKCLMIPVILLVLFCLNVTHAEGKNSIIAEQVYQGISSDVLPTLAAAGEYPVGVKTIDIVNPKQLNILTQSVEDRKLVVEVWYPAKKPKKKKLATYEDVTRLHKPFSVKGNAYRDANISSEGPFPLVVLSHGYTGYRTLMFYLGEHLASHGFIVASIDHTDSTNADVDFKNAPFSGFLSTLYNRSRDHYAALEYFTELKNDFSKSIDGEKAGLVGYSMGGYGTINSIGGCYAFSAAFVGAFFGIKDQDQQEKMAALLNSCAGGQYDNISVDKKWKAAVAIAPWGNQHGIFNQEALADISTPVLFISGDQDDISHHGSIKKLFSDIGTEEGYFLTYQNARHNIAAHPAPSTARSNEIDFGHYWEASWNAEQINAVNKHFILAMMNCYIKGESEFCNFLDLPNNSTQVFVDGKLSSPWKGFPERYSTGMQWDKK